MRKFSTGPDVDFDRLKTILVNSGYQSTSPPLFQTISGLINGAQLFRKGLDDKLGKNDKISLTKQVEGNLSPKNGGAAPGQYNPNLTLISNLNGSGVDDLYFIQTGPLVTVFGRVQVVPAAIGVDTELGIELPIISYFKFDYQCAGSASSPTVNQSGAIIGDVGNNRAKLKFLSISNATFDIYFNFGYIIIEK